MSVSLASPAESVRVKEGEEEERRGAADIGRNEPPAKKQAHGHLVGRTG